MIHCECQLCKNKIINDRQEHLLFNCIKLRNPDNNNRIKINKLTLNKLIKITKKHHNKFKDLF